MDKNNECIIGIDLGTTNSISAIWKNRHLDIISDRHGNKMIPSIVAFDENGILVGHSAKAQLRRNPKNTIYEIKRLIGRSYTEETVQNDISYFTYDLEKTENDNILIKTEYGKKRYAPEQISAYVLRKLKNYTKNYLKKNITKAVITIPAYFNDSQRQATIDAAKIAGIDCVRTIHEPTAAAIAYGLNNLEEDNINVVVYDLGGGTLDISLLNIDEGIFKVIATTGNTHLGGSDFDEAVQKYCIFKFEEKNPQFKGIVYSAMSLQKLRIESERAKIILSTRLHVNIYVKDFYKGYDININLSRNDFESICENLFLEALRPVDDLMFYSDMLPKDIDEIILVGGSTRIPKIRFMLHNYFNKRPNSSLDPDYVVAAGAAIQGYLLSHKDDPFCEEMILIDVIPLSLGIESNNGLMTVIIPRNTTIPTKKTKRFTTEFDNQEEVIIKIYEGERRIAEDNFHVGTFVLNNIEKAEKGKPDIRITMNIDINGIISVTAIDKKNNSENRLVISGNKRRLSQSDIDKMVLEAEKNELEDDLKQNLINLYKEFIDLYDMVIYNTIENEKSDIKEEDKTIIVKEINSYLNSFEELIKDYKRPLRLYKNIDEKEKIEKEEIESLNLKILSSIGNDYNEQIEKYKQYYDLYLEKLENENKKKEKIKLYQKKIDELNNKLEECYKVRGGNNNIKLYKKEIETYEKKISEVMIETESINNLDVIKELKRFCSIFYDSVTDKSLKIKKPKTQKQICKELRMIIKEFERRNKYITKKYSSFVLKMDNSSNIKIKSANAFKEVNTDNEKYDDINFDTKEDIVDIEVDNLSRYFAKKKTDVRLNKDNDSMPERRRVFNICNNVIKYINYEKHDLSEDTISKIITYIDNVMIWMNVQVHISKDEYNIKSEEINSIVKNIMIEDIKLSPKEELTKLCYSLINGINQDKIKMHPSHLANLKQNVDLTLDWIEKSHNTDPNDKLFSQRINELMELYKQLNNS